jgi:predicted metal-dependent phosphoesterase TrpH
MRHYDLHTHSTASDGALSPSELVARAVEHEVDVLALTDHDGTEGIAEALLAAQHTPLTLIPGVEISVSWNAMTVHIVGLNVDIEQPDLQAGLSQLRAYRTERAHEIACRLDKAGIAGALEGARKYASETMLGRLHFARFLVDAGHAKDLNEVFKRFLVRNKPGYVPGQWATLEDAVQWINAAGGQAVVAHPARYRMTATKLKRMLGEFAELGGVGMEVVSGRQHPHEVATMAQYADQIGLLASCGSDFHAPDNPWVEVGKMAPMPLKCRPIWETWAN